MATRRKAFLALLVFFVVSLAVIAITRRSEPMRNNRPLSYWVKVAGESDREGDPIPIQAIEAFGTNALPHLLEWITYESKPSPLKESIQWALARMPSLRLRSVQEWTSADPREYLANTAADAFRHLGTNAKPAIPALVRIMNDRTRPNSAMRAIEALASMNDAFPYLLGSLTNRDSLHRSEILLMIAYGRPLQTNIVKLLPVLLDFLTEDDLVLREAAVATLALYPQDPLRVVPAITNQINAPKWPSLRARALMTLGEYGTNAVSALAVMRTAFNDPDRFVRSSATNAVAAVESARTAMQ